MKNKRASFFVDDTRFFFSLSKKTRPQRPGQQNPAPPATHARHDHRPVQRAARNRGQAAKRSELRFFWLGWCARRWVKPAPPPAMTFRNSARASDAAHLGDGETAARPAPGPGFGLGSPPFFFPLTPFFLTPPQQPTPSSPPTTPAPCARWALPTSPAPRPGASPAAPRLRSTFAARGRLKGKTPPRTPSTARTTCPASCPTPSLKRRPCASTWRRTAMRPRRRWRKRKPKLRPRSRRRWRGCTRACRKWRSEEEEEEREREFFFVWSRVFCFLFFFLRLTHPTTAHTMQKKEKRHTQKEKNQRAPDE